MNIEVDLCEGQDVEVVTEAGVVRFEVLRIGEGRTVVRVHQAGNPAPRNRLDPSRN